jgi:hypothetical protein
MNKIPVTRQDLEKIANHIGFDGLDLSRISTIFILQIKQKIQDVILINNILNEIRFLEGIKSTSSTKPAKKFRHQPLHGLMKKHFYDEKFYVKNLSQHFSFEYDDNKKLDNLISEAFSKNTSGYIDTNFSNYIADGIINGIKERAIKNELTGEWIVFKQHNGKNYYLTLASHREKNEDIYKRVCDAYKFDFSFLQ